MKNIRKGQQRETWGSNYNNHGGNIVWMLAEDDYSAISRKFFHKDALGAK